MKYFLDYLKEERHLEIVNVTNITFEEEYLSYDTRSPFGIRIFVDTKDIDIVISYSEYSEWLEKKYEAAIVKN